MRIDQDHPPRVQHQGRFNPGNGVALDGGVKGVVRNALGGKLYVVRPLGSESWVLAHDGELRAEPALDEPCQNITTRRRAPHHWPEVDRRRA